MTSKRSNYKKKSHQAMKKRWSWAKVSGFTNLYFHKFQQGIEKWRCNQIKNCLLQKAPKKFAYFLIEKEGFGFTLSDRWVLFGFSGEQSNFGKWMLISLYYWDVGSCIHLKVFISSVDRKAFWETKAQKKKKNKKCTWKAEKVTVTESKR